MPSHLPFCFRSLHFTCIVFLSFLLKGQIAAAQCNSTITSFPYQENFENNNGGWTTGGNASDWTWGKPQKTNITSAYSGVNCWITGGLTKGAYNDNENAYLQSPCFDVTTLLNPYIRFAIFIDTEQDWDGANLQYSADKGKTWTKLGAFGQPQDCLNSNWYNNKDVHFLGDQDGWSGSGTIGGKWTTAQMQLPFSGGAGKTIMFRFYFGAGNKNNNYDGFGLDDFFVDEAPAAGLSFNYSCANTNEVNFTANASPCLSNLQWNFDDPASGAANQFNGNIATHQFAAIGNHLVNLTATDNNGHTVVSTGKVNIITAAVTILNTIPCAGGTAKVQTVVGGDQTITYDYKWSTSPQIITAAAALPAGNYLLQVDGENTCPSYVQVGITAPLPLILKPVSIQSGCNTNNGSIHANATGGTTPLHYDWRPPVSNTADADNLQQGHYNIVVSDVNGCSAGVTVVLQPAMLPLDLGNDTTICYGQKMMLDAGNFDTYVWDDLSNKRQRIINKAGVYFVTVTNTAGCTASDTIKVISDCGDVYFPSAFTPNGDLLNDVFGPSGNIGFIKNYQLQIYNRLGNLVFASNAPAQKWNGRSKTGAPVAGTYIYTATYEYNGVKKRIKGVVILLL